MIRKCLFSKKTQILSSSFENWYRHSFCHSLATNYDTREDHGSEFSSHGRCPETRDFNDQIGYISTDSMAYCRLLQQYANAGSLLLGKVLHAHIIVTRKGSDHYLIGNNLMNMYVKAGNLADARYLFDEMSIRDIVSWNTMISGYVRGSFVDEALNLFQQTHRSCFSFNEFTYGSALRAVARAERLKLGKQIHGIAAKTGYYHNVYVGSALLDMYARCQMLHDALQVFGDLPEPNRVSWNAIMAGYAQKGFAMEALKLFSQMRASGMGPDRSTFASVVTAIAEFETSEQVRQIHGHIVKSGLEYDLVVTNALVTAYGKCKNLVDSERIFGSLSEPDLVSWNAMLACYGCNANGERALELFIQMQNGGCGCDKFSMTTILSACGNTELLSQGKCIHGLCIRLGFDEETSVKNALITMYLGASCVDDAVLIFNNMLVRDKVSWNSVISGYAQQGYGEEAMKTYNQMLNSGLQADKYTFSAVLRGCAVLADEDQGRQVHKHIVQYGLEADAFVGSALVSMYAKCGLIESANQAFDETCKQSTVPWNVMIAGYGQHGLCKEALELFQTMQSTGIRPDHITFVSVLSACSHAGLIEEGLKHFNMMNRYGIVPRMEHYAVTVDIFGRAGSLEKAMEFIKTMPFKPDDTVWRTLLGACAAHKNVELGAYAAERLAELVPQEDVAFVLLSNIYGETEMWENRAKMIKMMRERGLRKEPGCSWIKVHHKVHVFMAEDTSHPMTQLIYAKLNEVMARIMAAGYTPNTSYVRHDVDQEKKMRSLCCHSEKLAISFGLLSTSGGTILRIDQNLRVCGDCHSAIKFISRTEERYIVLRDAKRFHHFKDGTCSCGDFW